ncbi:toprim domain-containing protein [Albidovulum sediminicola]|uniref:Toprim domain-containing protein n=1 Tax=Albidovulum sediminicola TaxID=2984331 RepID=A0ABT2Z732_9RHOB|nr:toprim domain-containing protein [Defluviimonas sp. WL0075]MCV2866916.1 toprim domain-containing protein [Defluviimonas sp. WL0075]
MTDARHITLGLGGDWHGKHGNAPCPVCQPERRADQRALSLRDEGGRLLAYCHKGGCDFREIVNAAGLPLDRLAHDPIAQREAEAKRADYERAQLDKARALWCRSMPITGTKGETYLRGRGITCALPPSLRWTTDLHHAPSGRWLSAMVAEVSTGAVHRTFFEKTGRRITGSAKMMLGPCGGGAVPLSEGPGALVVCEGLETGLSLCSGLLEGPATVWAALSAPGMKALHLPERPGRLIVATDGDEAGENAGRVLAGAAHARGWEVSLLPAPQGLDWNDVLQGRAAA